MLKEVLLFFTQYSWRRAL
uniref:Uncharacterized protein n=1 Tax=Anguilla anguilla TaxID=7936 RepID=A0A0E9SF57_ANGAN